MFLARGTGRGVGLLLLGHRGTKDGSQQLRPSQRARALAVERFEMLSEGGSCSSQQEVAAGLNRRVLFYRHTEQVLSRESATTADCEVLVEPPDAAGVDVVGLVGHGQERDPAQL